MSQTDHHSRPPAAATVVWDALSTASRPAAKQRLRGPSRRSAAIGNLGFQPHSAGDGDRLANRRSRSANGPKRSTVRCMYLAESREAHDTMTYCNKLILIPAVTIAAALLLPALGFAQVRPPPAPAPPAVALPAIPPAQKVPEAKTPLPAPAEAVPAPVVPPALAEPNAIVGPPPAIPLTLPRDLSPWGMFLAADIVVKAVMVGLAFASRADLDHLVCQSLRIAGCQAPTAQGN